MKISFLGEGPLASACLDQLQGSARRSDLSGGDLLISVQHNQKVPKAVLDRFRLNVNLHTGLLPANKGVYTCSAPILRGDPLTGVTIHEMTDRIDCGDIILQQMYPVCSWDTCESLHEKALAAGADIFRQFLAMLREPHAIEAMLETKQPQVGAGYRTLSSEIDFTEVISDDDPLADRKKRAYFYPERQFPAVLKNGVTYRVISLSPEVLQVA